MCSKITRQLKSSNSKNVENKLDEDTTNLFSKMLFYDFTGLIIPTITFFVTRVEN